MTTQQSRSLRSYLALAWIAALSALSLLQRTALAQVIDFAAGKYEKVDIRKVATDASLDFSSQLGAAATRVVPKYYREGQRIAIEGYASFPDELMCTVPPALYWRGPAHALAMPMSIKLVFNETPVPVWSIEHPFSGNFTKFEASISTEHPKFLWAKAKQSFDKRRCIADMKEKSATFTFPVFIAAGRVVRYRRTIPDTLEANAFLVDDVKYVGTISSASLLGESLKQSLPRLLGK